MGGLGPTGLPWLCYVPSLGNVAFTVTGDTPSLLLPDLFVKHPQLSKASMTTQTTAPASPCLLLCPQASCPITSLPLSGDLDPLKQLFSPWPPSGWSDRGRDPKLRMRPYGVGWPLIQHKARKEPWAKPR